MKPKLSVFVLSMLVAAAFAGSAAAHANAAPLIGVTAVSAGATHTCALAAGRVYCWGSNFGELGDGTVTPSRAPIRVVGAGSHVRSIAAADRGTCAATRSKLMCWGWISGGGTTWAPRKVRKVHAPIKSISLGARILGPGWPCVAFSASVSCGYSHSKNSVAKVAGLDGKPEATAAGVPNCAIVAGAAQCWGRDFIGRRGDGPAVNEEISGVFGLGSGVTGIANGPRQICAVVSGAAKCWGEMGWWDNAGYHPVVNSDMPVGVPTLGSGVTAIATGELHACAIVDGAVKCWGSNQFGQLGDGTNNSSTVPVSVAGLDHGVTAITAGGNHTCAIVSARVKCWGEKLLGEMRRTPAEVPGVAPNVRVRGKHQASESHSIGYGEDDGSGGSLGVNVRFEVPAHVLLKDACDGSVTFSVTGKGFPSKPQRVRLKASENECVAGWRLDAPVPAPSTVIVRISSRGNTVLKPFSVKETADWVPDMGRGGP